MKGHYDIRTKRKNRRSIIVLWPPGRNVTADELDQQDSRHALKVKNQSMTLEIESDHLFQIMKSLKKVFVLWKK